MVTYSYGLDISVAYAALKNGSAGIEANKSFHVNFWQSF